MQKIYKKLGATSREELLEIVWQPQAQHIPPPTKATG